MKKYKFLHFFYLLIFFILISCNEINHQYDGSYAMNMTIFGASMNSKIDLVINGDKAQYNGEVYDCKQFSDRIEIGNGKVTFSAVDGDLIVNIPNLGKIRYLKISGENKF